MFPRILVRWKQVKVTASREAPLQEWEKINLERLERLQSVSGYQGENGRKWEEEHKDNAATLQHPQPHSSPCLPTEYRTAAACRVHHVAPYDLHRQTDQ